MLPVKEFRTADELHAHYRALYVRVNAAAVRKELPTVVPLRAVPLLKRRGGKLARKPALLPTTTLDRIMAEECCRFGVLRAELLDETNSKKDVDKAKTRARWVVAYRAQTELGYSLTAIGNKFGMDRTSIAHGAGYVDQLLRGR